MPRKIHLCFVEAYYPRPSGPVGGAGTYIQNFGKQLIKTGYNVSVICACMGKNSYDFKDGLINVYPVIDTSPSQLIYYTSKVPILKLFTRLLYYLHNGLKIHLFLLRLNQDIKIDFIEYTEGGDFWNTITKKFKYSSHLHGSPYTFMKQSGQLKDKAYWIGRKAELFFIGRSEIVFSPSKAMVNFVESEMKKKMRNVKIIPYPIDASMNKDSSNNKENESGKVIIIFASRNDPVKGGDLLISALKQIPDDLKRKISVEIYGFKPERDIFSLEFLKLYDFIPKDDLLENYNRADICVIPSLFDNSPNTVYEAMAKKKVIVASIVGGIPEIIGGTKNGFLFNPLDINDLIKKLTDAIELVLSGNSEIMGKSAQDRIFEIANLKSNTKKRLSLIFE